MGSAVRQEALTHGFMRLPAGPPGTASTAFIKRGLTLKFRGFHLETCV